jgi:hypothetical protein
MITKLDTMHLRWDSRAAANKGFALAGVPCFADTFTHNLIVFNGIREPSGGMQGGSSVLRMKLVLKHPAIANPRNVIANLKSNNNQVKNKKHDRFN